MLYNPAGGERLLFPVSQVPKPVQGHHPAAGWHYRPQPHPGVHHAGREQPSYPSTLAFACIDSASVETPQRNSAWLLQVSVISVSDDLFVCHTLQVFTNSAQALPCELGPDGKMVQPKSQQQAWTPAKSLVAWRQRLSAQRRQQQVG